MAYRHITTVYIDRPRPAYHRSVGDELSKHFAGLCTACPILAVAVTGLSGLRSVNVGQANPEITHGKRVAVNGCGRASQDLLVRGGWRSEPEA
nr:hypothetical protein [Alteraurantiacibacter aquimixticola]